MGQNRLIFKKSTEYNSGIADILGAEGFLAAMDLRYVVKKRFKVSDENARKIIQRAVTDGAIVSSAPLTFGKGQYVYLDKNRSLTKSIVKEIASKYRPPLYRLIAAIDESDGIISYYEGLKVTASPTRKTKSKVNSLDELIMFLKRLDLVVERMDEHSVKYIIGNGVDDTKLIRKHYLKQVMDCVFIPDILLWMKDVNIISKLQPIYRNKKTPSIGAFHNDFVWDAFAYTKTTGINAAHGKIAATSEKQTLVVFDIVMSREYGQIDLDGFMDRIRIVQNSVKTTARKVMPIVVYKSISEEILNKLSSLGFLCFDIGAIYGKRIYEVIDRVANIKEKILALRSVDSANELDSGIDEVLNTIHVSGQEENLSNIKGDLFESLLYPLISDLYPSSDIIVGRTLTEQMDDGKKEYYEYDYIVKSSKLNEIVVIELKGYSSSAFIPLGTSETKNTLNWFFRKTLPFAQRKFAKEISDGMQLKGCFITSARFHDDCKTALVSLNAGKLKSSKLNVSYDGLALIELLEGNKHQKAKSVLQKYYFKQL